MFRKCLTSIMAMVMLIITAGCTAASDAVYSNFHEYMYIDPATGEFVDPATFVPNIESEVESSDDNTSSDDLYSSDDSTSSDDTQSEDDKNVLNLNVADFGAKGDGKTDDANAIYDAVTALMQGDKGSKLVFGKNKTYYMKDNDKRSTKALDFRMINGATVEGNGSTILVDGELNYLDISNCTDFTIKGLNFDRKIRSHFVGTVYNIDYEAGYFDVVSDRDFGFYGEYVPAGSGFAFVNDEGIASRRYMYMDKLTTLSKKELKYRFYVDMDGGLGTDVQFNSLTPNRRVIIPTPYIGHYMPSAFNISGCENVTMKDVNVWNIPHFGFAIGSNSGKLVFDNVDLVPPEDEDVVFVSWRDGFHCKHNTASIIWKDCEAVGLGDDIINISNNMMHVSKRYTEKIVGVTFNETNGSYGSVEEGAKVSIYDVSNGKMLGITTIKRVISEYENIYELSDVIPGLKTGENIRFSILSHAAPNSQLINCDFEGTLRFKGSGGIAKNCKLSLYALFMYPETYLEGPIPHDITFSNCDFTGTWEGRLTIYCDSPVSIWKEGNYRLENIRFENCKGLKRSLFSNELNFNEKSVDYITITPALTE